MDKSWSRFFRRMFLVSLFFVLTSAHASEQELEALLREFLANVSEAQTHDRFWADDLVYTSSRGTRSTKADIMAGFEAAVAADASPGPTYTAEDLHINVYGDTAIVAFRLVAIPPGSDRRQEYFNTGTFLLRNDEWRAIAWQATIIPDTIIPAE